VNAALEPAKFNGVRYRRYRRFYRRDANIFPARDENFGKKEKTPKKNA
jgi:hypothetical protein